MMILMDSQNHSDNRGTIGRNQGHIPLGKLIEEVIR